MAVDGPGSQTRATTTTQVMLASLGPELCRDPRNAHGNPDIGRVAAHGVSLISGVVIAAGWNSRTLRATMLTGVSVVWNGWGRCEIWRIFFKNHATFCEKVLIILVRDRVRSAEPEWQPTLMSADASRWLHLRSTYQFFSPYRHHDSHHGTYCFDTARSGKSGLPLCSARMPVVRNPVASLRNRAARENEAKLQNPTNERDAPVGRNSATLCRTGIWNEKPKRGSLHNIDGFDAAEAPGRSGIPNSRGRDEEPFGRACASRSRARVSALFGSQAPLQIEKLTPR